MLRMASALPTTWSAIRVRLRSSARRAFPCQCARSNRPTITFVPASFAAGTVIFLNVERVDSLSAGLTDYVRAWIARLLEEGVHHVIERVQFLDFGRVALAQRGVAARSVGRGLVGRDRLVPHAQPREDM